MFVFSDILKDYISFVSRVEGSKNNAKHGEWVDMYMSGGSSGEG